MLPRLLCEELCSLNPAVDRLAFSATFELTPAGDCVREEMFRSVRRRAATEEDQACNMHRAPCNVQRKAVHTLCNVHRAKCMQLATCNSCSVQHTTYTMQHEPYSIGGVVPFRSSARAGRATMRPRRL